MSSKWKVLTPKTQFPLRVNSVTHEPLIQKTANFNNLYKWQQARTSDKQFTLHDGPPYANGELHMGHVLNKVLKDIVNRYKLLKGFKLNYRPGWDCHGLPIELKACHNLPRNTNPLIIRKTAATFAKKTVQLQQKSFQRWGLVADWSVPYLTMSKQYESNQIDVFYKMYQQGCIYRGFKPVYWSPSSHTALAEAELEYQQHNSLSVFVLFPSVFPSLSQYGQIESLIWTTTPWTLPANRAICYNPNHVYSLIRQTSSGKLILVGAERLSAIEICLGSFELVATVPGTALTNGTYTNPLDPTHKLLFLPGTHVSADEGTGLVHTAPSHGFDDYAVGLRYNLNLQCIVNEEGQYLNSTGMGLDGLNVLDTGNDAVVSKLESCGALLQKELYSHRYPYDWRTKQPVIIRSTEQWFASVQSLREKAMAVLTSVKGFPESAISRMKGMLETRQEWCISRQRVWGVPIPVFYHRENEGEVLVNDSTIDHIKALFLKYGSDCWWELPLADLLPCDLQDKTSLYERGNDTLDVWFDSGSSWATVLGETDGVADMYLEGSDQYRGWFQSSLLTSVAVQGQSPYRQLVSHGFVLDSDGAKMSKSLGNILSPDDIINKMKLGADTMRLWAASSNFTSDVSISSSILEQTNDFLQKLRNTARFLLGNLSNFSPDVDSISYCDLPLLDRYQLHLLHQYFVTVEHSYESLNFSKIYHTLTKFVPQNLSAFYFDIIKDRLYCDSADNPSRKGCQTVLHHLLTYFTMSLAPILPHLAEEINLHYKFEQEGIMKCYHLLSIRSII